MSIPRIHHAALVVPDLAAAVQLYCEFLAMDISFRTSWTAPSPEIDQLVGISDSSADVAPRRMVFATRQAFELASTLL